MNIIQSTVTMLSLFTGQSFYTGDTNNCLSIGTRTQYSIFHMVSCYWW